jgi:hypothetical protein
MPWWSWIVLWGALVLGALALLAWIAFRLFHKLMAALRALGDLGDQVSRLGDNTQALAPERRTPAIFGNRDALARAVATEREARAHARQLRRDALIKKGKLLHSAPVSAPASQRTPPHA